MLNLSCSEIDTSESSDANIPSSISSNSVWSSSNGLMLLNVSNGWKPFAICCETGGSGIIKCLRGDGDRSIDRERDGDNERDGDGEYCRRRGEPL